jgi:hypothetical protein
MEALHKQVILSFSLLLHYKIVRCLLKGFTFFILGHAFSPSEDKG